MKAIKCSGENCSAINGNNHSLECMKAHDDAYKTPGNRNPDARYQGYKGRPMLRNYTLDEQEAYKAGVRAREPK